LASLSYSLPDLNPGCSAAMHRDGEMKSAIRLGFLEHHCYSLDPNVFVRDSQWKADSYSASHSGHQRLKKKVSRFL